MNTLGTWDVTFDDAQAWWIWLINNPSAESIFGYTGYDPADAAECNQVLHYVKTLHDTYGATVTLNCFYSTIKEATPDTYRFAWFDDYLTMADIPTTWKAEFAANSDWLKFSMHCYDNATVWISDESLQYFSDNGIITGYTPAPPFTVPPSYRTPRNSLVGDWTPAIGRFYRGDAADQLATYGLVRDAIYNACGRGSWLDQWYVCHQGTGYQSAVDGIRDQYGKGRGIWPLVAYEGSNRPFWFHLYGQEIIDIRTAAKQYGAYWDNSRGIMWLNLEIYPDDYAQDMNFATYIATYPVSTLSRTPFTIVSHEYNLPGGNLIESGVKATLPTPTEAANVQSFVEDACAYASVTQGWTASFMELKTLADLMEAPNMAGLSVTGMIVPKSGSDSYPTHDSTYGKGGYQEVANVTARNAIAADRRREGMVVRLADTKVSYVLEGGTDNANWTVYAPVLIDDTTGTVYRLHIENGAITLEALS